VKRELARQLASSLLYGEHAPQPHFARNALGVRCVPASLSSIFCRGSRVGCNNPGVPIAIVTLDQPRQFLRGTASHPRSLPGQLEPDYRERSSISLRSFRRSAECDQRIQVAKAAETSARQTWRALNRQSRERARNFDRREQTSEVVWHDHVAPQRDIKLVNRAKSVSL